MVQENLKFRCDALPFFLYFSLSMPNHLGKGVLLMFINLSVVKVGVGGEMLH